MQHRLSCGFSCIHTDVMTDELLMVWCIDIIAIKPSVSRAFTIILPIGNEEAERVIIKSPIVRLFICEYV